MAEIEIIGTLGEVQKSFSAFSQGVSNLTQTYIAPNIEALNNFNKALSAIKTTSKYFVTKPIDGDAIIKSLPKFNKETRDKFKNLAELTQPFEQLTNALKNLAQVQDKAQSVASSMSSLAASLEKIKTFAVQLNDVQSKLNPKPGETTQFASNYDVTVFGSVGLLLDKINASVNNESLAKFRSVADAMRTFTSSLVDMIKINKNFQQGLQKFLLNFTKPVTNEDLANGKFESTPFDKLGELIDNFVTKFSVIGERTLDTSGKNIKSIMNPKIQGIRDIFDAFNVFASDLKTLSGVQIDDVIKILDTFYPKIREFIEKLGLFGARTLAPVSVEKAPDGTETTAFKQKLDLRVQGVKDLLSPITTLANDLKKLSAANISDAFITLDSVKEYLPRFISEINDFVVLYTRVVPQDDGTVITETHLNEKMKGFMLFVNTLTPLANSISKLSIDDGFKNKLVTIREATTSLIENISPETKNKKELLQVGIDNLNLVSEALSKYANSIPKLNSVSKAGLDSDKLLRTKAAILKLIEEISPETTDKVNLIQAGVDNMNLIAGALGRYSSVLASLNKLQTANVDFDKLAGGFKQFIKSLSELFVDTNFVESINKVPDNFEKKFKGIGGALKNVSSFINSMLKGGDFIAFRTNIENAIPSITDFINKMAQLASLPNFADFERVANALGKFNGRLHDATETVKKATQSFARFKAILRQIYTAFVGGAVIYSIVRGIKSAIKEMFDLEYAMARVNTIARVSKDTLKQMTHQVQDMSARFGVESEKVSKALYDINSATIKGSASMKILQQSIVLAVAGFTDVEKVSDLIAKAVNAYEYNVNEAAKISDILFVTVERGINPMEELSEYFGRLFTVSANAGVSLEEVASGLATLTARGYQTNVASTALNSAILKLSTGTKELNKLFRQYGYASSASALRTIGLTGALQILYKATNGATDKLHDLGFNYRDIRAATTLASGAINEYNKTLAMMNDENYKAGRTLEAEAEVINTVKFKFDQLKATLKTFVQTIAEYLDKNEAIRVSLGALSEGVENVTKSMRGANLSVGEKTSANLVTLIPKFLAFYGILQLIPKPLRDTLSGLSLIPKKSTETVISVGNVTNSVKGLTASLKTLSGVISSLMKLELVMGIATGTYGIAKGLKQIAEQGTFWSGISDYLGFDAIGDIFSGDVSGGIKRYLQSLVAMQVVPSAALADMLSLDSDFGYASALQQWIKPSRVSNNQGAPAYFDEFDNILAKHIREEITGLRTGLHLNFDKLGYSEESINSEFDRIVTESRELAESLQISQKQFNEIFLKPLLKQKDELLKDLKEFEKIHPEITALRDVFSDAGKNISENFEKNMGALQKEAYRLVKVQNAFDVLEKETGLSKQRIKTAFNSSSNFDEFTNIIKDLIEVGLFTPSKEFNNAMMELSTEIGRTEKNVDAFTKSIVKLGVDINNIATDVSLEDIIGNAFNLSSVSSLRSELHSILSSTSNMLSDTDFNAILNVALTDLKAMKSFEQIYADLKKIVPNITDEQLTAVFDKAQGMINGVSEYLNELSNLDFLKFTNKLHFGGELSAFNQYAQVDSKTISALMESNIGGRSFRDMLRMVEDIGLEKARRTFDEATMRLFDSYFKKLQTVFSGSPSSLQTEYENFNKKADAFVKKYRDSLLTPIQKFEKIDDELNLHLKMLEIQAQHGMVTPELLNDTIQNMEELQKLNEEVMTMKVPSAITASEAVRTGSKEAFDLVATNIFRDMYKVNVQQSNYQKDMVNKLEQLVKKSDSSLQLLSYP